MGTSEIYRAVLSLDEVVDALVVDLPRGNSQGYMPLFVVLRNGVDLDDEPRRPDPGADPGGLLAAPCAGRDPSDRRGPPHAVGQVLEVPVKRILSGEPIDTALSRDSLANPDSLRPFELLAERPNGGTSDLRLRSRPLRAHAVSEDRTERSSSRRSPLASGTTSAPTARSRRARSSAARSTSGSRTSISRTTTGLRTGPPRRRSAASWRPISARIATSS